LQKKPDPLDSASMSGQIEARERLKAVNDELENDPGTEVRELTAVVRQYDEPYRNALIEPFSNAMGDVADDLERMCANRTQALQIAGSCIPLGRRYVDILSWGGNTAIMANVVLAAEAGIAKLESILEGKNPFPEKL
jgi:hypothetical protein